MNPKKHDMITAGILTISDKGARGEREDLSGLEIRKRYAEAFVRWAPQPPVMNLLSE